MRLLNPSGLWLLLGIPILIIIYLIKSQHEDTSVSSTYIWKLSSRFMKKKLPIQRLKKILIFLLQLLMVICAALMVSRPAIDNGMAMDYIAIIDASASMNTIDENGQTRFEKAVSQAAEMADVINQGHNMTIIVANDGAFYAVRESSSVSETKAKLSSIECGMGGCDIETAMELAQNICDYSNGYEVYFFTDSQPAVAENITVVNLNQLEWNVAIDTVKAVKKGSGTEFRIDITSFNKAADVAVGLKIDGKIVNAGLAECPENETIRYSLIADGITSFDKAEVYIDEKDSLEADNSFIICPKKSGNYKVLLVSEEPLYLGSALNALGNCEVDIVTSAEGISTGEYDLVVYDRIGSPDYNGKASVLQFGTNVLPSGLTAGAIVEEEAALAAGTDAAEVLFENVSFEEAVVSTFTELIANDAWDTIITADGTSVGVTRQNDNGAQITVISFDLHDSNLPLKTDFTALVHNIVEYSAPYLIKKSDYSVGESVTVTAIHDAESIYVIDTEDEIDLLTMPEGVKYAEYIPDKPGVYTAALTNDSGAEYAEFFVHIPVGESAAVSDAVLKISSSSKDQLSGQKEAVTELWMYVAGLLFLLLLAEWGVYCYEQR